MRYTSDGVLGGYQRAKGYLKRQGMLDEAVEREVKKKYPAGLSQSAGNMMEREKIRKDLKKKLSVKNPKLLTY